MKCYRQAFQDKGGKEIFAYFTQVLENRGDKYSMRIFVVLQFSLFALVFAEKYSKKNSKLYQSARPIQRGPASLSINAQGHLQRNVQAPKGKNTKEEPKKTGVQESYRESGQGELLKIDF